jgi:hypothetical protein
MKKLINFFRKLFGLNCPKYECNPCKREPEVSAPCAIEQDVVHEEPVATCAESIIAETPAVTETPVAPKKKKAPRKKKQPAEKK